MFSNPQIVRYCNETIRPLAGEVTRLAMDVQSVIAITEAQGILAVLLAADQTSVIDDGSDKDGRPLITVGQLVAFLGEVSKAHAALDTTNAVRQAAAIQANGYNL